ncbi:hypothetical protein [Marinobacter caseinilyticus]|uniref:hypothetical protein n=1 Tax=Marinobacter caseinilyticus TaxID=2692195 RepID=UPI00140E2EAF|nr:hypothetical protein [Marinobacter caseinilyticus]
MTPVALTEKAVRKARNRLNATISAEKMAGVPHAKSTQAITDPVITPFLMAMEAEGYEPQKNSAGAPLIERCDACNKSRRFTFTGAPTGEFKLCADCRN